MLSYAIAPVTAAGLRRNAPDLQRPFFVRGFCVLGPLSFIISALIVYWSGWNTISWLLGLQILMFLIYILFKKQVPTHAVSLRQQVYSSLWLVAFYALIIIISYLGSFGGIGAIGHPWDTLTVAVIALAIYYWGAYTCLPQANFVGDEEE